MFGKVTSRIRLNASREVIFSILSDFNSYEQWMPDVMHSHVLVKEGDITVLELMCPAYKSDKFVVECIETSNASIVFTQIDQYRQGGLYSKWEIAQEAGQKVSQLTGQIQIRTEFYKELVAKKRVRGVMERTMAAIGQRVQQVATNQIGFGATAGKTKLLEVVQKPTGIEVRFLNETFELKKK